MYENEQKKSGEMHQSRAFWRQRFDGIPAYAAHESVHKRNTFTFSYQIRVLSHAQTKCLSSSLSSLIIFFGAHQPMQSRAISTMFLRIPKMANDACICMYSPYRCRKTNAQFLFPSSEFDLWPIHCRRARPTCLGCSRDETKPFRQWTWFVAAWVLCPIANWTFCTCPRRIDRFPTVLMIPMSVVHCNTVCRRSHFDCNCRMLHSFHANWMICPVMWSTFLSLNITEWGPCRSAFKITASV